MNLNFVIVLHSYTILPLVQKPWLLQLSGHNDCKLVVTTGFVCCSVEFTPTNVTHCCKAASTCIDVMLSSPVIFKAKTLVRNDEKIHIKTHTKEMLKKNGKTFSIVGTSILANPEEIPLPWIFSNLINKLNRYENYFGGKTNRRCCDMKHLNNSLIHRFTYHDVIYAIWIWRIAKVDDIFFTRFVWLRIFECQFAYDFCLFSCLNSCSYLSPFSLLKKINICITNIELMYHIFTVLRF